MKTMKYATICTRELAIKTRDEILQYAVVEQLHAKETQDANKAAQNQFIYFVIFIIVLFKLS